MNWTKRQKAFNYFLVIVLFVAAAFIPFNMIVSTALTFGILLPAFPFWARMVHSKYQVTDYLSEMHGDELARPPTAAEIEAGQYRAVDAIVAPAVMTLKYDKNIVSVTNANQIDYAPLPDTGELRVLAFSKTLLLDVMIAILVLIFLFASTDSYKLNLVFLILGTTGLVYFLSRILKQLDSLTAKDKERFGSQFKEFAQANSWFIYSQGSDSSLSNMKTLIRKTLIRQVGLEEEDYITVDISFSSQFFRLSEVRSFPVVFFVPIKKDSSSDEIGFQFGNFHSNKSSFIDAVYSLLFMQESPLVYFLFYGL